MRVCKPITIRYAETDMMGIVYHANYFLYFEDARAHYLEQLGFPYDQLESCGYQSPVVNVTCNYGAPLHYGDRPLIVTYVSDISATRVTYSYEVYRDEETREKGKPNCSGSSVHCLVDTASFRPVSMKKAVPDLYAKYCEAVE